MINTLKHRKEKKMKTSFENLKVQFNYEELKNYCINNGWKFQPTEEQESAIKYALNKCNIVPNLDQGRFGKLAEQVLRVIISPNSRKVGTQSAGKLDSYFKGKKAEIKTGGGSWFNAKSLEDSMEKMLSNKMGYTHFVYLCDLIELQDLKNTRVLNNLDLFNLSQNKGFSFNKSKKQFRPTKLRREWTSKGKARTWAILSEEIKNYGIGIEGL